MNCTIIKETNQVATNLGNTLLKVSMGADLEYSSSSSKKLKDYIPRAPSGPPKTNKHWRNHTLVIIRMAINGY